MGLYCARCDAEHPVGDHLGTRRFNYNLQRHEVLMHDGWVPTVPDLPADTWLGVDKGTGDRQGNYQFNPRTHMALTLWAADNGLTFQYAADHWAALDVDKKRNWFTMADAALDFEQKAPANRLALEQVKQLTEDLELVRGTRDTAIRLNAEWIMEVLTLREELDELKKLSWLPTELGDHDYHGPTEIKDGKRVPVRDLTHERFHAAVGDVLAGRINKAARRQMQEALKNAPKEPVEVRLVDQDDRRRMGTWSE